MSRFAVCCKECGNDDFYLKELDNDEFELSCKECGVITTSKELICGIIQI